jgi:hypothetical protein
MKQTLITIILITLGIVAILYVPAFVIYGVAGWQLGTWCNHIATKLTKTNDDVY